MHKYRFLNSEPFLKQIIGSSTLSKRKKYTEKDRPGEMQIYFCVPGRSFILTILFQVIERQNVLIKNEYPPKAKVATGTAYACLMHSF